MLVNSLNNAFVSVMVEILVCRRLEVYDTVILYEADGLWLYGAVLIYNHYGTHIEVAVAKGFSK